MINKKVIILVMCSSNSHYKQLENCIKETWFNIKSDDVEIIFYSDNMNSDVRSTHPILVGNDVILPCNDGVQNCGIKTLMALNWVNDNYTFDYIYRSNLGAYVDTYKLLEFLSNKPKKNFYCGIIGTDTFYLRRPIRFASGSGYFLSSDLVSIILQNNMSWNHNAVDDVALGDLMCRLGVEINLSGKRMNLCDDNIYYEQGDKQVSFIDEDDIYHIRLRSDDRELDIRNMKMLYEKKKEEKCTN